MKIFLFTLLFPFVFLGQQGTVSYGYKHSLGIGAPMGADYNSILVFNTEKALFITRSDFLEGGHVDEYKQIRKEDITIVTNKITNSYGFRYFTDLSKDSIYTRDIGFTYVQSTIPKIDWKLHSETKKIGNYTCAKATASFRGRTYTAWFTTEIPLPYGPWKLQGLPGLILEAYDTHKEIFFYFKNISYPSSNTKIAIVKPSFQDDGRIHKWITFDEYKKKLIDIYISRTNHVRVVAENYDSKSTTKKYDMSGSYIEVFDVEEYLKAQ